MSNIAEVPVAAPGNIQELIILMGNPFREKCKEVIIGFLVFNTGPVTNQDTQDTPDEFKDIRKLIREKQYHQVAILCEELSMFKEAGEYYKRHAEQHRNDAEDYQAALTISQTWLEADRKRKLGSLAENEAAMRASYAKAADTYKKAVAMCEKAGDYLAHAKMCREVAQSLKKVEDWEQAAEYYEMAADIFESHNIEISWAKNCRSTAENLRARAESRNRDKVASP